MKKNRNNTDHFVNFNDVDAKSSVTTGANKTNPLNDGVKNADDQQNVSARLNMPRGARKPESTFK
jgi:hypothetical protein